jgi:5-methylcytosine-specific restriction protein B
MNSADRSIAIVDIAVRRRFGFVKLLPQASVVSEHGCPLASDAFNRLVAIFVEHASDEAFNLVPGHSYFLVPDQHEVGVHLNQNLVPLLEEYLAQGYVAAFAEEIRAYLQWVESLV